MYVPNVLETTYSLIEEEKRRDEDRGEKKGKRS